MIKQLVSNIGIFAQKFNVFNDPLTSRSTPPQDYASTPTGGGGGGGGVDISESESFLPAHTEKG